jgi:myosin heavy subunit
METNKNSGAGNKRGYIGAIVVLLLLNALSFYLYTSEKSQTDDLGSQKTALQEDYRMLSDTLQVRNTEIEAFTGRNAELDKALAAKQEETDLQKQQIERLLKKNKLTQAELSKLRDLVAEYKSSIAQMGEQIAALTQENQQLHAENGKLSTDLNTEKQATAKLTEQNQYLGKKVEIGSLLPVASLDVEAVRTRNNGKEVEVKRAKTAANLRIKFETGENKVLDPGPISVYVRIINPNGETIAVEDQGSGSLQPVNSAEPMLYTKRADFEYDQNNKTVVVYWGKNIQQPGVYKVELYQAGYVIAQGEVKLS